MITILSPAKRMAAAACPPGLGLTAPVFLAEAAELGELLRQYPPTGWKASLG